MQEAAEQTRSFECLLHQQTRVGAALLGVVRAEETARREAFARYLPLARTLLREAAEHEDRWPGSLCLADFAQPLVQQASMFADYEQAAGHRDRAAALRCEADELTARYLSGSASALVTRNRAMVAAAEGRFHEALVGLDQARSVLASNGDVLAAVQTELDLANVYEWLGDYGRALDVLRQAHDQVAPALAGGVPSRRRLLMAVGRQAVGIMRGRESREGEDALALFRIALEVWQGEGRVRRHLGDYDEAERLLGLARPSVSVLGLAGALDYHLAAIALARGDVDRAEALLTAIAPTFDKPLVRPRRAALRQLEADVHLARERPAEALRAAEEGLADQDAYPDLDLQWKLQWRRARALLALGRDAEALAAYEGSAASADTLRVAPLGHRLDTTFLHDKLAMFESAIALAAEREDGPAAIRLVELVKSRALAAAISVPREPTAARAPEERTFDELSARVDALAFQKYAGLGGNAVIRERDELLQERDRLLERLRIADPRWRSLTAPARVDVADLQQRLTAEGRAALTLHEKDGRIVAAIVDGDGADVAVAQLSPDVTDAVRDYASNLRLGRDPFLYDFSQEFGVDLTDLVPAGLAARACRASTLLVVPHGVLHLLPWAALLVDGRRLFELTTVGVLPNLACLTSLDAAPCDRPRVALIGDADYGDLTAYEPLIESGPEIRDIAALYGEDVVAAPSTGPDATDASFWALAEAAGAATAVLHVSGHGTLEATEPLASGLLMTGSTVDAAEVVLRRLPFPEVVLSACSTGWRPQTAAGLDLAGDDALGLPAAFLEAGARFLLVSVPKVRDDTARTFTTAWHRHRRTGAAPLAAYRATQLEMLAAAPQDVFAWAGITAYGTR